ncbi:MAG: DUF2914 domain-containing protein [Bacteroidota bacterium]|jgi:hypothetical protein
MKRFSILCVILLLAISGNYLFAQEETKSEGIQIIDAKLGKDVKERMIVDEDSTFEINSKVFLWLKVVNSTNETLTVLWKHGSLAYETKLAIGGSPWRTWAVKTVFKTGEWSVSVTDASGNVLKELTFTVK